MVGFLLLLRNCLGIVLEFWGDEKLFFFYLERFIMLRVGVFLGFNCVFVAFRDVGVTLFIVGRMVFGAVFFMFVRRCKVSV